MDAATAAIVGSLGGAIVATVGTVFAQHLSARQAERRADAARRDDRQDLRRTEMKAAIDAFFLAAQRAESASDQEVDSSAKRAATDILWSTHKSMVILGSDRLREAANAYADGLHAALWNPNEEAAWSRVFEANKRFTASAKEELGSYLP